MRVLFIGDIVGKPGRSAVKEALPGLRERLAPDLVVANAENAAGGFGLTRKVLDELFGYGLDLLTTGNHIWDKKEILAFVGTEERLLRPANYPPKVPGRGIQRLALPDGRALWVLNLQGKILMAPVDCPFRKADELLAALPAAERCILVDMHAEATSEKRAMGFYLDGRVSLVIGTHTHVPTADEEILPKGTGYLTDAGMTGPYGSVIGMEVSDSLERILTGMPRILNVAKAQLRLAGLFAELDDESGRCLSVERILLSLPPA
ncbi:MAG: TIGR00282 family metallophosphoesterase [Acidobacteriota bacterium]